MEVKKIVEGMTAPQVAQVIDENFNGLNNGKTEKTESIRIKEKTFRPSVNNNSDVEILKEVELVFSFSEKQFYDSNLNPVYGNDWGYSEKIEKPSYGDSFYVLDMESGWGAFDNGTSISTVLYYNKDGKVIGNEVFIGRVIKRTIIPPIESTHFSVVGNKKFGSGKLYLAKWKERFSIDLQTNGGNVLVTKDIDLLWLEGGYYNKNGEFIEKKQFYTAEVEIQNRNNLFLTMRNSVDEIGSIVIKNEYEEVVFVSNEINYSNFKIPSILGGNKVILSVGTNLATCSLYEGVPRPLKFEENTFNPTQYFIADKTTIERKFISNGYFKPDGTIVDKASFFIEEISFPEKYENNYYIDIPGYKRLGMGGIWFLDGKGISIDIWSFDNKCIGMRLPKPKGCTKFWICRGAVDEYKIYMGTPSSFEALTESKLIGKKYTAIGDSITNQGKYIQQIVEETGVVATNLGVGGMKISGSDGMATPERLSMIPNDSDIITISGGTNDWYNEIDLGDNNDETLDTFKGALNILIKYVLTNIPKALIVICSTTYGEMYNKHGGDWENSYTNRLGLTTNEYGDAMIEIAKKWNLLYVDTGRIGYNTINIRSYMKDDGGLLHPNDFGGRRIGKVIAAKIKDCFND